jgi:hypothetical protein
LAPIVRPSFVHDFPIFTKEKILRRSTLLVLLFIRNRLVMVRSLVSHDFQPNLFLDELGHHGRLVHTDPWYTLCTFSFFNFEVLVEELASILALLPLK